MVVKLGMWLWGSLKRGGEVRKVVVMKLGMW